MKTIARSLTALAAVLGLALPALAQDQTLSGLPLTLTGEPEVLLGQRARQANPKANPDHQFAIIASVESWRSEMDTSSESGGLVVSDAFVLHSATIVAVDYRNNSLGSIEWGAHAGIGYENVGVDVDVPGGSADEVMDGGFIFEFGGGLRYTIGGTKWDIGGDILFRFGDHDGTGADYDYQMIRFTGEGGYQIAPEVRLFAKFRFNGLYEGEMDYSGPADFETEIDLPIGISLGADLETGPILASLEIMLFDVEDFGFAASVGWKF